MQDKPRALCRTALASALQQARTRVRTMVDDLSDAQLNVPRRPTLNPFLWEYGHVGWFQEFFCLRGGSGARAERPSMLANADRWYDSGRVAHDTRWSLDLPERAQVAAYVEAVLQRTLAALDGSADDDVDLYRFRLALYHEDMHAEAFTHMRNALAYPARAANIEVAEPTGSGDVQCAGGAFDAGMHPGGFVFDNEKWAHPQSIAPFGIAARRVTNGEFAAFVDDQGYSRDDLWCAAGLRWRAQTARAAPRDWHRDGSAWYERRFDQSRRLEPDASVRHVCCFEAEAYCSWAKRRLPTEFEWELAVTSGAIGAGGLWEWTASPFLPYPGFSADAYADYSAPWFGTHRVLRGASFATPSRLSHPRFRNFYVPERDDMLVGFRTCALADS